MKYLLLLTMLLVSLNAKENLQEKKEQTVTLGVGLYMQTQPYKSIDPIIVPSPVVFFDNGLFYVRWSRVGMYFLGKKGKDFSWAFSLTAEPRPFGYETKDVTEYLGLDARESTVEGGLAFSALYHTTYLEVMALTDLLARHNSWLAKAELGDEFHFGDLSLYPSLVASYQSDAFVNYYYGVTQEEAARTHNNPVHFDFFEPKGGFQVGAQSYLKYPLTKNLATLLNARVDSIPESAHASPLIKDTFIYSGLLSLIYTFHY